MYFNLAFIIIITLIGIFLSYVLERSCKKKKNSDPILWFIIAAVLTCISSVLIHTFINTVNDRIFIRMEYPEWHLLKAYDKKQKYIMIKGNEVKYVKIKKATIEDVSDETKEEVKQ